MSHTHEDRIADRPPHLCAAYGCMLIGTSTASTTGSSEWYCFAHFGAEVGRYQAITRELNEVMQPAQQQALAIDKSQSTGNFAKVGFDMPA